VEQDRAWLFPTIVVTMVTALAAAVIKHATGYSGQPNGYTSLKVTAAVIVVTALVRFLHYLFGLWQEDEDKPIRRVTVDFRLAILSLAPIIAGVAIIGAFLYSITFLKSMITAVIPFWADPLFAASDSALFIDPQAIAVALAPVLPGLALFYGLWHAAHLGDKARHILSFMLTWGVGMALAYIFSSAGPIFTGSYDASNAPAMTQKAAAFLWANYEASGARIGGGISAFPSMHVAIAAWLVIVLADRRLLWLGIAYFSGVFACSIILGWHYAIDSVAGAAIAVGADRLSQAWLRRRGGPIPQRVQPAAAN
jgi:hypothetical protein